MLRVLLARCRQGYRTMRYPAGPPPEPPARFAGLPALDAGLCRACAQMPCVGTPCVETPCVVACPVGAIRAGGAGSPADAAAGAVRLDLGACLFCRECAAACPHGAVTFGHDHRLAARRREDLILAPGRPFAPEVCSAEVRRRFGRSFRLRQVSAGGCNACEADTNVLGTVGWDLGRFGIQFVASPRHADGLLITGPVTENMRLALEKTWRAVPDPKVVIAAGACAVAGGPYRGHPEARDGAASTVPVDLFIPGCPPHPLTILDGLLRFLGRAR